MKNTEFGLRYCHGLENKGPNPPQRGDYLETWEFDTISGKRKYSFTPTESHIFASKEDAEFTRAELSKAKILVLPDWVYSACPLCGLFRDRDYAAQNAGSIPSSCIS